MNEKFIICVAIFLMVLQTSTVNAAELHIASPATVVVPGQTFTVGVGMISTINSVVGVDSWLNYDNTLADFVSVATASASLPALGGPQVIANQVGFSVLAFDGNATTSAVKGTWDAVQSPLAIATFQAKKAGKLTISPVYSSGSTTDSNIVTLDLGSPTDILAQPTDQLVINIAPCILANDLNYDGRVDIVDLMLEASKWNTTDLHYDLNNDGRVDIVDLMLEASKWGTIC